MLIFLLVNVGCPDLFLTMGVKRRPRGVEHKGVWSESVMTSLKMFWWPWFNNDGVGGSPQQKQQKQKPAETSATATLVRTIARQNAIVLRDRYAQQRTLATACRRKGVAAEAVAADLIRAEQRGFRRQMNESQVYMALHELRLMVWRATGTGADPGCECARQCAAAAAQELRGVLRYFESGAFDADSAAHLAALEALSEDAGASAGARCLAALQARTVRGICDATRQGDKAATRRDKAIERARRAPNPNGRRPGGAPAARGHHRERGPEAHGPRVRPGLRRRAVARDRGPPARRRRRGPREDARGHGARRVFFRDGGFAATRKNMRASGGGDAGDARGMRGGCAGDAPRNSMNSVGTERWRV